MDRRGCGEYCLRMALTIYCSAKELPFKRPPAIQNISQHHFLPCDVPLRWCALQQRRDKRKGCLIIKLFPPRGLGFIFLAKYSPPEHWWDKSRLRWGGGPRRLARVLHFVMKEELSDWSTWLLCAVSRSESDLLKSPGFQPHKGWEGAIGQGSVLPLKLEANKSAIPKLSPGRVTRNPGALSQQCHGLA